MAEEEKKDPIGSFIDGATKFVEEISKNVQESVNKILGIEGGEGEEGGLGKVINDVRQRVRDTLGLEGEGGKLDLNEIIRNGRNRIRELLGMEPLPET